MLEPREFHSVAEIDLAIEKFQRRIQEPEKLDVTSAIVNHTGTDTVARSNVRETIRDVFGSNSPEFKEHEHIRLWAGRTRGSWFSFRTAAKMLTSLSL